MNRSKIVVDLDPADVCDGLVSKGIFTQDMIDDIQVTDLMSMIVFDTNESKSKSKNDL